MELLNQAIAALRESATGFGCMPVLITRLADQRALRWVVLLVWAVFARYNESMDR